MQTLRKNGKTLYMAGMALLLLLSFADIDTEETADPPGSVYLIHVEGLIDNGLHSYIDRGLRRAEQHGASGVVLYIDTFGGLVDAADNIRQNLLDFDLPVIAFIDKNAASAGALISMAADSIFMSPGSSIGAATVVDGGGAYASEKIQSYMRSIMRATAEAKGRDPKMAEAMVDETIEIEGIIEAGKLLSLSTQEAVGYGIADGAFDSTEEVIRHMGWEEKNLVDLQELWAESVLRFLANPVISSMLMLMMLGGLYFELQSPGIGFPGIVSGIGAMLFFAPLYIMGLAQSWEIILFAVGVLLLLAEVFVIPGFGVAGITGITLMIFSLGASLIGNVGLSFPELHLISQAIWTMAITLMLGVGMIASFIRYLPGNTMINRLVLSESTDRAHGYISADTKDEFVGMEGVTMTPLRPSGVALVNDIRLDVISDGEFIEKGAKVKVVDAGSSRTVVRKIEI